MEQRICNKCNTFKIFILFRGNRNKCRECEREDTRIRMNKLRSQNPEKYLEKSRIWRYKNFSKAKESVKKSTQKLRELNPEQIRERHRRYENKYPERVKESKNKWEENNREKIKKRKKVYRKENRELCVKHCRNRRARKKCALGEGATLSELIEIYGNNCYLQLKGCTKIPTTVEHIIPLSRNGTNYIDNLKPACKHCNDVKGKRTYEELKLFHKQLFINEPHTFEI